MKERTLAIIKPDSVAAHHSGDIIKIIELNKFTIVAMKKLQLSRAQAEAFYEVHKTRSFFGELVSYMMSGPFIVMALEKEDAVAQWRTLMGATNPAQAAPGTIRYMFGTSIGSNATHGSDAPETAAQELKFFFPELS
jgi:nucleoside-diphosphate kinase